MATDQLNKFNEFVDDVHDGQHDGITSDADVLKVALTNSAPAGTEANWNVTDFPEPTGSGYTGTGENISYTGSETTGTYTLSLDANVVWTAAGTWTTFRYAIFYNSSSAAPTNALIGWLDYGAGVTMDTPDTFTINSGTLYTMS